MRRALIRLYPAAWRERYGDELEALMMDLPAGWRGDFNVFKGALGMRLRYQSWMKIVSTSVVAGALLGFLGSYLMQTQFRAVAVLQIAPAQIGGSPDPTLLQRLNEQIQQLQSNVESRQSLTRLIVDKRLDLYPAERRTEPLESVVDTMRESIRVIINPRPLRNNKGAEVFTISFTYPDPGKAQTTVNALITRFIAGGTTLQAQGGLPNPLYLDVLDPPQIAKQPFSPKRSTFGIAGGLAGLILAFITLLIRRLRPHSLQPA